MHPASWLRLGAICCLLPSIWVFTQVADERTRYSILISAAVSALGFLLTLRLIPLTKAYTLKAGLFGLDINKKGSREGEKKVPESLGLASGVVFLVSAAARLPPACLLPVSRLCRLASSIPHDLPAADLHCAFPAAALLRHALPRALAARGALGRGAGWQPPD
jgi:hypothetical protein